MPLFQLSEAPEDFERAILFAFGEFQSRGFDLENREIALDRLLGAFSRAFERFRVVEKGDSEIAKTLESLGVKVEEIPEYVAKHPFRITVNPKIAKKSLRLFELEKQEKVDS